MNQWMLMFALLAPAAVFGQQEHFGDWKWKERQTDHFTLRADGTGFSPPSRIAEKVWDLCVGILPQLEPDFSKNEFVTPDGAKGSDSAPFRFTVYLVGTGADYRQLAQIEAKKYGWEEQQMKILQEVGNFTDPRQRFNLFCTTNPKESAGGDRDITPVFIHNTAAALLRGRAKKNVTPMWFTAGFGYYAEHEMEKRCQVYYLDMSGYYEAHKEEITKGDTFGPEKPWPPIIRRLSKKGERTSLEDVCNAQVITLSPKQSGYIFALTSFLVRDEPARVKYRKMVSAIRGGATIDMKLILDAYGYEDAEALETEWYEWIESGKFR